MRCSKADGKVGVSATLWTSIQEAVGSNRGRETPAIRRILNAFSQSLQSNFGVILRLDGTQFLPNTAQFLIHQIS
jgi:hypothetical protein